MVTGTRSKPSAWRPAVSGRIGIKYSLTLHAASGERLFGIDNAHGVTEGGGPGKKRPVEWDHEHRDETIRIYDYVSAAELLADFFAGVDRILDRKGVKL